MRTSTIVMIGVLGLAATPLALHLAGGSTATTKNWIKALHGGAPARAIHASVHGSGAPETQAVPGVPGVPGVLQAAQDTKPAPKGAASTLAGKWTVSIEHEQGSITSTMVLKQDGKTLTGTLTNPHGEGTLPITGEVSGAAVTLNVDATVDNGEMHLVFKGTIKDDGSLTGAMTSVMGESKWTAIRAKS